MRMKNKLTPEQVKFLLLRKEQKRKINRYNDLTYARVQELLFYDEINGHFYWTSKAGRKKKGKRADILARINPVSKNNYKKITIDGISYFAHRIAWLYMEGYFPEHEIDHINRIKNDNRWENLRHVTRACNLRNAKTSSKNTSGIKGVSYSKGRWQVTIGHKGLNIDLKSYPDLYSAVKVRWKAEKILGYPDCDTTSTAYLWLKKCNERITQTEELIKSFAGNNCV